MLSEQKIQLPRMAEITLPLLELTATRDRDNWMIDED